MNSQKGFSLLLIILIVVAAVVVVGGGAFVYQQYNSNPKPAAFCTPNWTCNWGPCTNGSQSQVATDSNNCGVTTGQIACSTLAQACATSGLPSIISISPTSGPVGTVVTLTGSEFTSGSATYIGISESGQKSWTPSSVSPSQLKFSIPAGLPIGSHNISVFVTAPQTPSSNLVTFTVTASTSTQPSITVTSPIANQIITSPVLVKGQSNTFEGYVSIRIKDSNGKVLANDQGHGGFGQMSPYSKSVTYSPPSSKNGFVEVFENSAKDGSEINKVTKNVIFGDFNSAQPSITVTSPNGGEPWMVGGGNIVKWSGQSLSNNMSFQLLKSGTLLKNLSCVNLGAGMGGGFSADCTIPADVVAGNDYKISVIDNTKNIRDSSDNNFYIYLGSGTPSITVTSPNGGELLHIGQSFNITWSSVGLVSGATVSIYLERKGPGDTQYWNIATIAQNLPQNGLYMWTPNIQPIDADYKIMISENGLSGREKLDESDNPFHIVQGNI